MSDPVAIIGAGPAGLSCARRLAAHGLPVLLIDDNAQAGGQYFRQLPPAFRVAPGAKLARDQARAEALLATLAQPLVTWWPDTTVWAQPEPLTLAYAGRAGAGRIRVRAIVVAAGAHDRPLPFHGWDLPGVMTAGGCLNLIKGQGMIPGGRIGLVGNGPLLLVVAYSLLKAGAEIAVIAEAAPRAAWLGQLPGLAAAPKLLWKGLTYLSAIRRARIPFLHRHVAVAAEGADSVSSITLAPLRSDGTPAAQKRRFGVDALVTGYGLAPSSEMTRLLGCAHRFDAARGGWIPERSAALECSIPLVFAVGDCAGIGGAEIALLEGEVVADHLASRFLGTPRSSRAATALRRLDRFRDALNAVYAGAGTPWPADTETTICRCEELSLAALQEAAGACHASLSAFKSMTRLGMGRCQGRNCLRSAAHLVGAAHGVAPGTLVPPRARAPVRPIPIAQLLAEPLGPARAPDAVDQAFHQAEAR